MISTRNILLAMAALACAAAPTRARSASPMSVQWKDGLVLSSEDGQAQVKLGMRVMNDWAFFDGDDELTASLGNIADGTEFRRARVGLAGSLPGGVEFKTEYDFAGSAVSFKDVYVGLVKFVGPAGIRVGHFKQPVGLELLTSSNDMLFLERASLTEMVPDRKTGVMIHGPLGESERVTFAASVYRETDGRGKLQADGAYSASGRVTGLVAANEEGDVVHLGVSGSLRNRADDELAIALAPEAHLAPEFDEFAIGADSWTQLGLEAAGVMGPAHVQAEHMSIFTTGAAGAPDVTVGGFYAQAGVFLTGESLPYKRSSAAFGSVKPQQNFRGEEGGLGAVQLVARYSRMDLDDGDAEGGEVEGITAGVNWYLNPNTRILLNYVRSTGDTPGASGTLQGLQTRFHVFF